jgi:hypothetical protein
MIVLQSAVRFRALSLTSDKPERSQNPLAHTQLSRFQVNWFQVKRHSREIAYQALPLAFLCVTLKTWEWPGDEANRLSLGPVR